MNRAETLRNVGGTSGAEQPQNSPYFRIRHLRCLPHSGVLPIPDGPGEPLAASHRLAPTPLRDENLCIGWEVEAGYEVGWISYLSILVRSVL